MNALASPSPAPEPSPLTARLPAGIRSHDWITPSLLLGTLFLACACWLVDQHSRGMLPVGWQRQGIGPVLPDEGYAYQCHLASEWMSQHLHPSNAQLLEDGVPLATPNALHVDIRRIGNGRFSFWHKTLLFSSSDNTDPRCNGKTYEIHWPAPLPRGLVLLLYPLTVLTGLAAFFACALSWTARANTAGAVSTACNLLLKPSPYGPAVFIFSIALAVGIINFAIFAHHPCMAETGFSILGVPYSDARAWDEMAHSLARGQGMLELWKALRPGYALFLACFYTWFGHSYQLAIALNLVLVALAAALILMIGERAFSRKVGLIASLAFILSPHILTYSLTTTTEILGLFLFVFAVQQLLHAAQASDGRSFFLAGLLLGLSNLARPLTLMALPAYLLCLLVILRKRQIALRRTLCWLSVLCLGLGLILGPWIIRQKLVHGIATISDNTAAALYAATSPRHVTWSAAVYKEPGCPSGSTVKDQYEYFMNGARANLRCHPGFYLRNVCSCFSDLLCHAHPAIPLCINLLIVIVALLSVGHSVTVHRLRSVGLLTILFGLILLGLRLAPPGTNLVICLFGIGAALFAGRGRRSCGVILLVSLVFAMLGLAVFAIRLGDPRHLVLFEWLFVLFYASGLYHATSLLGRAVLRPRATTVEPMDWPSDASVVTSWPAPKWLTTVSWLTLCFFLVSSVRLALLNYCYPESVANTHRCLSSGEAYSMVRALHLRYPWAIDECYLRANAPLPLETSEIRDFKQLEGKLLVVRGQIVGDTYFLPGGTKLKHWSHYFQHRSYDRTFAFFMPTGYVYPRCGGLGLPVEFRGALPPHAENQTWVLFCRHHPDNPAAPEWNESFPLLQAIALVPEDRESGVIDCTRAIVTLPTPLAHRMINFHETGP